MFLRLCGQLFAKSFVRATLQNGGGEGYATRSASQCVRQPRRLVWDGIESRGWQSTGECCQRKRLKTSIFELFKIGIGPSSSHTVGPMRAARLFAAGLNGVAAGRIQIELYGSLGLTGRGHGTDRAVVLGLLGEEPDQVDPARIDSLVRGVRESQRIALMGGPPAPFDELRDL